MEAGDRGRLERQRVHTEDVIRFLQVLTRLEALGWASVRTQAGSNAAYPPRRGAVGCISPWHPDFIYRGDRLRRPVIKDVEVVFRGGATQGHAGLHGEAPGLASPRREGRAWAGSSTGVSVQGSGEVDSALAGLSNSSGLWNPGTPGRRVIWLGT